MLSFSGTLVERDSRIAFAAGASRGVGQDAQRLDRSKDSTDVELKKIEAGFIIRWLAGKSQSNNEI
jgi:hypothetical protein